MKTAFEASPTAQMKPARTIGERGCVRLYEAGGCDHLPCRKLVYEVGEWHGIGDFRVAGSSDRSFRRAFEEAGIFEDKHKSKT